MAAESQTIEQILKQVDDLYESNFASTKFNADKFIKGMGEKQKAAQAVAMIGALTGNPMLGQVAQAAVGQSMRGEQQAYQNSQQINQQRNQLKMQILQLKLSDQHATIKDELAKATADERIAASKAQRILAQERGAREKELHPGDVEVSKLKREQLELQLKQTQQAMQMAGETHEASLEQIATVVKANEAGTLLTKAQTEREIFAGEQEKGRAGDITRHKEEVGSRYGLDPTGLDTANIVGASRAAAGMGTVLTPGTITEELGFTDTTIPEPPPKSSFFDAMTQNILNAQPGALPNAVSPQNPFTQGYGLGVQNQYNGDDELRMQAIRKMMSAKPHAR